MNDLLTKRLDESKILRQCGIWKPCGRPLSEAPQWYQEQVGREKETI